MAQSATASEYVRGALYGVAAVIIWAGFIVVARLGIRTSLTPWDIAAIRFTVSGSLLLPYVIRKGLALERLGWTGLWLSGLAAERGWSCSRIAACCSLPLPMRALCFPV
jgi:hypothetical protein